MNQTLRAQIDRIFQAYADWWDEPPNPVATSESIVAAGKWFTEHYGQSLPSQLSDFWRVTNGIDLDGHRLFATEDRDRMSGIVEFNELYFENFPEFFFLGTCDDIDMYAYHPETGKFRILWMFAFEHFDAEYDTFDELAEAVLHKAMDRTDLL